MKQAIKFIDVFREKGQIKAALTEATPAYSIWF